VYRKPKPGQSGDEARRGSGVKELVARSIITVAATGERDPEKLKERAIHALSVHKTDGMRKIDAA